MKIISVLYVPYTSSLMIIIYSFCTNFAQETKFIHGMEFPCSLENHIRVLNFGAFHGPDVQIKDAQPVLLFQYYTSGLSFK